MDFNIGGIRHFEPYRQSLAGEDSVAGAGHAPIDACTCKRPIWNVSCQSAFAESRRSMAMRVFRPRPERIVCKGSRLHDFRTTYRYYYSSPAYCRPVLYADGIYQGVPCKISGTGGVVDGHGNITLALCFRLFNCGSFILVSQKKE